MKMIMITAPSSNTGKTTITLGLIRALRNRGIDVSAFKTGPDFIDKKYLSIAARKYAGNLDMHMQGREGLRDALAMNLGEVGIIEGAMGYFDGIANTFENSSYDISKELDVPSILVYTPKGEMFSAIPKIKGMVDFEDSKIKGIIFNKTSKSMYEYLKEQVEKHVGIKVLGYLPESEKIVLGSRNLGLDESYGIAEKEYLIDKLSRMLEETIDIDGILSITKDIQVEEYVYPKKRNIKVGIASDEAFNFHYTENLKMLRETCDLEFFSLLRGYELPSDVDLVYIGGGYPELYSEELAGNKSMIESIQDYVDRGKYLVAEGGGLMYLTNAIDGIDMVGIIDGESIITDKLGRFGYVNIETKEDSIYGPKGTKLVGNEYHKSEIKSSEDNVFKITKPMSSREWACGYSNKNMIGYYQHINFLGNMTALENLFDKVENNEVR